MNHVSPQVYLDVVNLLHHEAILLEENRLEEWLDLLTEDIRYFFPVNIHIQPKKGHEKEVVEPPANQFNYYDEDKKTLRVRIQRYDTGLAHAELPISQTQRLITNIHVEGEQDGMLKVRSSFLVYQERRGRVGATFIGRRHDLLRREANGALKIASRRIQLGQTVLPTTVSIFF